MVNKTKIICTIGPSSRNLETIVSLIKSGMDAARLNFSHGEYESHLENIKNIRKASEIIGDVIPIIMDLQGPKIRVGKLKNGKTELIEGKTITIKKNLTEGNNETFSTTYNNLSEDLKSGDVILLDDGLLKLKVREKIGSDVLCVIIKGGILKEKKGLNLPHTDLRLPSLTEKDISDIDFGIRNKVDMIALSFVRKPDDVINLKKLLEENNYNIPVISKIERPEAISMIDKIIDVSDAVMVARGDLGIEISPEDVPVLQKMIIKKCNETLKPVITATQMLESMINNIIPTRAEASDVANAILDGTDCVMLSGETSVGTDPVNVLNTMERIIEKTETVKKPSFSADSKDENELESLCFSATELANRVNAKIIVTITRTGKSPLYISSHRIQSKIISASTDEKIIKFNQIIWGVKSYHLTHGSNLFNSINEIKEFVLRKGFVQKKDKIIVIYNKLTDEIESADTISILEI